MHYMACCNHDIDCIRRMSKLRLMNRQDSYESTSDFALFKQYWAWGYGPFLFSIQINSIFWRICYNDFFMLGRSRFRLEKVIGSLSPVLMYSSHQERWDEFTLRPQLIHTIGEFLSVLICKLINGDIWPHYSPKYSGGYFFPFDFYYSCLHLFTTWIRFSSWLRR